MDTRAYLQPTPPLIVRLLEAPPLAVGPLVIAPVINPMGATLMLFGPQSQSIELMHFDDLASLEEACVEGIAVEPTEAAALLVECLAQLGVADVEVQPRQPALPAMRAVIQDVCGVDDAWALT